MALKKKKKKKKKKEKCIFKNFFIRLKNKIIYK
jgi:hypothetical protein